ncbi:flagellar protein MotY [Algicola sagamiensis]|uniref:flagellar protein MotY n=1 Tax=Algicola sagamiensis TaxID=163869 RepID=UPI00039BD0DF|nr:OmpA family protein [Algicola sagamiensis]
MKTWCALVGSLFVVTPVAAGVRYYQAELDSSIWQYENLTRLQCSLQHEIPHYGKATFTSKAGKEENLNFELDMLRLPSNYKVSSVASIAPNWRPGIADEHVANMPLMKQFNGELEMEKAWVLLTDLEQGLQPTFYYSDWYNKRDHIAVGLSSMNFRDAYFEFLSCLKNLLPFGFEDISFTVLNYISNSDELTLESKERLNMIGEYVKNDPKIREVVIQSYSDSYGGRWHNLQLSKKRANKIKDYFASMGVEDGVIQVEAFGEKRHAESNKTILGRNINRRVVIKMAK